MAANFKISYVKPRYIMVFLDSKYSFKTLKFFFIYLFVYEMYKVKVRQNPHYLKYKAFRTKWISLYIMLFLDLT